MVAALQLLWALAGLIAEPSFDFGDDAATQQVLGVDFNGVHALSGFLLFCPAFYFAPATDWALYYAIYAAVALIVTGIWALFTNSPAGSSPSPTTTTTRSSTSPPAPSSPSSLRSSSWHDRRRLASADDLGGGRLSPARTQAEEEDHAAADGHDPHLAADDRQREGLLSRPGRASKSRSPNSRWAAPARAPSAMKETTRGRIP